MSGIVFAAVALTVVVLSLVLLMKGVDGSRRSRMIVAILALAPAALVCAVFLASMTRLGSVRVAMEGAQFRMLPSDEVTVGGASDDDLVVSGLPAQFLEFRTVNGGVDVLLQKAVVPDQDGNGYAVVRVDDQDPFANAVALGQAPVEIAGRGFDFSKPGIADAAGRRYPSIPARIFELGSTQIRILRELPPDVQIHPLRFLAAPTTGNDVARTAAGGPLGSFICRADGFLRQTLYVVLTGDEVTVKLADGRTVAYDAKIARIDKGQSRRLALHRVDYSDPRVPNALRSRVQERRSFSVAFDGTTLKLVFDTPEYVYVSRAALRELAATNSKDTLPTFALTIPGLEATIPKNEMLLSLSSVGSRLAYELFGRIRLEDDPKCPLHVTTHEGIRCFEYGDGFAIGEDAAALFRINQFEVPFASMLLIIGACLATLSFGTSTRDTALHVVTYAAVETLLGLRILIGYAGSLDDPGAAPAYWQSILALILAPFVIRTGVRLARGERQWTLLAYAVVTLFATAIVFVHAAGLNLKYLLLILVLVVASAAAMILWRLLQPLVSDAALSSVWRVFVFAGVLVLFRVLTFFLLGWKERIALGFAAVAVSLYYVPATVILFAMIWGVLRRRARQLPTGRAWVRRIVDLVVVLGLFYVPLATFHGVLPKVVSDTGSILVFGPPLLIFFALPFLERRTLMNCALAAPVLVVVVLVIAPLVGTLNLLGGEPAPSPSGASAVTTTMTAVQAENVIEARATLLDNLLRIYSIIDPERVASAGTKAAERMVVLDRTLRRYNSRGALGAGYLNVPVTQTVDTTQLNDNLSSVHVMATFGWLGALAVLLLALLPAFASVMILRESGKPLLDTIDPPAAIGILSLWTIAGAALYMFAANLGIVFFTGKNVYFLAAASESDVVEGVVLVVLALIALQYTGALSAVAPRDAAPTVVTPADALPSSVSGVVS